MSDYWDKLTNGQKAKMVVSIILLVFVLIFAVVNWKRFPINFIFVEVNIPLTLIILVCLLIGYSFSTLYEYKHFQQKVKEIEVWRAKVEQLEAELVAAKTSESTAQNTEKVFPPVAPSSDVAENSH